VIDNHVPPPLHRIATMCARLIERGWARNPRVIC
jgi:hypothetical protein